MARMQETVLGCSIWALIDMLIWPVTNIDALKKTATFLPEDKMVAVGVLSFASLD